MLVSDTQASCGNVLVVAVAHQRVVRDVGRAAIRDHLAQVAREMFLERGFDAVTISDLAVQSGVSRSTVLRYFGTKEDAVLGTFDAVGVHVTAALRGRPTTEDNWTALRRAFDAAIASYADQPTQTLQITRLIQQTPALRGRGLQKQHEWQPDLAAALAERNGNAGAPRLADRVMASTALICLALAAESWTASDGRADLVALLDEAWATFLLPQTGQSAAARTARAGSRRQ